MTNEIPNAEDPKNLPFRLTYSPITGEVYVVTLSFHGIGISMMFDNKELFHQFVVESIKFDDRITDKVIKQAEEILKNKQGE